MNITTKFDIGQRVYAIHRGHETLRDECPLCGDTDVVLLATGQRVRCPEKYGSDHRRIIQRWWPWVVRCEGTVGQVRVEIVAPEYMDDDRDDDADRRRQYMLKETGVGSGSLYNEVDLCASREEAEAECAKRNAVDDGCQPGPAWNGPNKCKSCRADAGGIHSAKCKHAAEIAAKIAAKAARTPASAAGRGEE